MNPGSSRQHTVDRVIAHAVLTGQPHAALTSLAPAANVAHHGVGQFRMTGALAARGSPSGVPIGDVIELGADLQMRWVTACRLIAPMPHHLFSRQRAIGQLPNDPMGAHEAAGAWVAWPPISATIGGSSPWPALVAGAASNLRPEPSNPRRGKIGLHLGTSIPGATPAAAPTARGHSVAIHSTGSPGEHITGGPWLTGGSAIPIALHTYAAPSPTAGDYVVEITVNRNSVPSLPYATVVPVP